MASDAERFAAELPPASDGSWRDWLEGQCGIPLAAETVHEHICVLSSPKHEVAQRSALTDGTARLQRVLGWLHQAAACGATQAAGRPVLVRELRQALVRGQG